MIKEKEITQMILSKVFDKNFFYTLELNDFKFIREVFKGIYNEGKSSNFLHDNFINFSTARDTRFPDSDSTPLDDILD